MKKISLVLVCCISTVAQAEYRMLMPLEVKNNGRLPDGSIIFNGANGPTTPVEPVEEGTDCMVDVAAGTYYLVQEAAGESMIVKGINNQRISNGTRGKLADDSYAYGGIHIYELCMNGEAPQPYVEPVEVWGNGECKYNTLGTAQARYWAEADDDSVSGQHVFLNSYIGDYGYLSYTSSNMSFLNFGTQYTYGIQVKSNSKVVYNGATYYKGKFIRSTPNSYSHSENGGQTSVSDMYYYEVCRTQ
jgi:hypothetical protein